MYTLLLRLSGPLQSWGSGSLYDTRDTDYYPTKSAIIGMIAAALGRAREESCDDLSSFLFGIRVDSQGVLIKDFQITDMGQKLNKNLSSRMYLSDATFLVGLSSDNLKLLKVVQNSLHNPKFMLFLGRKSCPPTMPIELGIVEKNLYDALFDYDWLVPEKQQDKLFDRKGFLRLRIVVEEESGELKRDVPVSFESNHRQYGYRGIKEMPAKVVSRKCLCETQHNPFIGLE